MRKEPVRMTVVDVLEVAQLRIIQLALDSAIGERDAAREIAMRLECENAKHLALIKKLLAS